VNDLSIEACGSQEHDVVRGHQLQKLPFTWNQLKKQGLNKPAGKLI
jgi:hypothetical protein